MGDAGGVTLDERKIGSLAACPLLRSVDGSYTSLFTVLDAMQTDFQDITKESSIVDLSDSADVSIFFHADQAYTLVSANFIYTEASSADAGINISMGKMIIGTDDVDYFVDEVASVVSQETADVQALTLLLTAIAAGDVLTFSSAGGKTGTGEGFLQVVLRKA
jgi:hypothetical protein